MADNESKKQELSQDYNNRFDRGNRDGYAGFAIKSWELASHISFLLGLMRWHTDQQTHVLAKFEGRDGRWNLT